MNLGWLTDIRWARSRNALECRVGSGILSEAVNEREFGKSGRPPDEAMTWDEDPLEYGYILDRLFGGGWWHLHFGRAGWLYQCNLLGRRTDVLACLQRFAAGAVAVPPRFVLTLDGEGVELSEAEL